MFDKRYTQIYGPNKIEIDIIQKRETTEDTVRLYHELLEKARGEVIDSLVVDNSLVNFAAMRINTGLRTKIVMAFELNGKLHVCEAPMEYTAMVLAQCKMELIRYVIQQMADAIANKLLENLDSL
jgi:hypothetical protein